MNSAMILSLILLITINNVNSHSFSIPSNLMTNSSDSPTIHSYHIHCQFINGDKAKVAAALSLRSRFVNHFNLTNVEACKDLFTDIRLCMFSKMEVHKIYINN